MLAGSRGRGWSRRLRGAFHQTLCASCLRSDPCPSPNAAAAPRLPPTLGGRATLRSRRGSTRGRCSAMTRRSSASSERPGVLLWTGGACAVCCRRCRRSVCSIKLGSSNFAPSLSVTLGTFSSLPFCHFSPPTPRFDDSFTPDQKAAAKDIKRSCNLNLAGAQVVVSGCAWACACNSACPAASRRGPARAGRT